MKVEICGLDDVIEVFCFVGGSKIFDIVLNNGICVFNVRFLFWFSFLWYKSN